MKELSSFLTNNNEPFSILSLSETDTSQIIEVTD